MLWAVPVNWLMNYAVTKVQRWAVPRYFFSTGTAGSFQKSSGTAVLLFFIFRRYSVLF